MKIDIQEIAAIAQAEDLAPRWNLYAGIHKALRACMSDTLVAVGRMDVEDELEFAQTCQRVLELMDFCRGHLQHENAGVHPAMEARAPSTSTAIAAEHLQHETDIAVIASGTTRLMGMPRSSRGAGSLALYHQISLFLAHNFEHMLIEEREHNAVLWAHYTDAELQGIEQALHALIAPHEMMADLRWMLPALAPAERAAMLRGLRQDAPAPVFQAVMDLARNHLDPAQWNKLERALALDNAA